MKNQMFNIDSKKFFQSLILAFLVNGGFVAAWFFDFLPMNIWVFGGFFFVVFFVALRFPGWIFGFLIAGLSLENVILSPKIAGLSFRPFQVWLIGLVFWFSGFLVTLLLAKWRCYNFEKPVGLEEKERNLISGEKRGVLGWFLGGLLIYKNKVFNFGFSFLDKLVLALPFFGFLSLFGAVDKKYSLKQTLVLLFFVLLYFLTRIFLQTVEEKIVAVTFLFLGALPVIFLAFLQAVIVCFGWHIDAKEVFAGRVNATFPEPDWLALFLSVTLVLVFWLKLAINFYPDFMKIGIFRARRVFGWLLNGYFFLAFWALFLTVARSGWIAWFSGFLVFWFSGFLVFWLRKKNFSGDKSVNSRSVLVNRDPVVVENSKGVERSDSFFGWGNVEKGRKYWKSFGFDLMVVGGLVFFVVFLTEFFGLSSFHFFNRAASSFSGKQLITISCPQGKKIRQEIQSVDELAKFDCRHINLEEIAAEEKAGRAVQEVLRPDPNVGIRRRLYVASWEAIKQKPILGWGLGSSGFILGKDSRGAAFNSSNIFVEAWLCLGLGGFAVFLVLFFWPIFKAVVAVEKMFKEGRLSAKKFLAVAYSLLVLPVVLVGNLFNAGIFLAFVWVVLGSLTEALEVMEE